MRYISDGGLTVEVMKTLMLLLICSGCDAIACCKNHAVDTWGSGNSFEHVDWV